MRSLVDRSLWRWLRAPWSEWASATALVGAAAVPALLVGSADVYQASSEDEITALAVAATTRERTGVQVLLESEFDPDRLRVADEQIRTAADRVGGLEPLRRSVYTLPGLITIGPSPLRAVGPNGRLFSQPGALDAIDVVAGLVPGDTASSDREPPADGVWITTWFADRHDIALGDGIAFEAGAIADEEWNDLVQGGGADSVFVVVGFYEPLWSAEGEPELDPFWSTVPPAVLPTYVDAFSEPNLELVVAAEETVAASGLTGVVEWRADTTGLPDRYDDLLAVERRYRTFERSLVGTGDLGRSLSAASTAADRRPILTTDVFDTVAQVRRDVAQLDGPLDATRGLGGVAGLASVVAVGAFLVDRRRSEFRLLVSEGDGPLRLGLRAAVQLVAPFAVGTALGVVGAVVGPAWFGPADGVVWSRLAWRPVSAVSALALVLVATTIGVLGASTLRRSERTVRRAAGLTTALAVAVTTVAAWVQVGRTTGRSERLDLVVVAVPVLVIAVASVVALFVVGAALARLPGRSRLPPEAYLAVRRLGSDRGSVRVAAAALGLGVGLLAFSTALVATLDRATDLAVTTELGGTTSVVLIDDLPTDFAAPAPTTVLRVSDTRLTPGDVSTRVIAIDPATFVDAVSWSDEYVVSPAEVVEAVSGPTNDGIPMVGIEGERSPGVGAFGVTRTFPYRIVERAGALPASGARATTVLASADVVDLYAARSNGYGSVDEALEDGYPLPIDAFRRVLVSQSAADELTAALDDASVRYRDVRSFSAQSRSPTVVATRSAFAFLQVVGLVSSVASLVSLTLFLSARRRRRALAGVLVRSMGLPAGRAALVSVIEIASMVLVAMVAALASVPPVVRRLAPRFDPAPGRPPAIETTIPWWPLVATALLGTVVIGTVVWCVEWSASRRPAGQVLRDGG